MDEKEKPAVKEGIVFGGGSILKHMDSIRKMEKIIEQLDRIPRMCLELNSWCVEPSILCEDRLVSSILERQNNLVRDVFGLSGIQNGIYKETIENAMTGLISSMQEEQRKLLSNPLLDAVNQNERCRQWMDESMRIGRFLHPSIQAHELMEDITTSKLGIGTELTSHIGTLSQAAAALAGEWETMIGSAAYMQSVKILDQYQNSWENICASIQQVSADKYEAICQIGMDFDIGSVSISEEGALSYQGAAYEKSAVPLELERQVQNLKQEPVPFKEKVEGIKQKYWLLLFLMSIYVFVPGFMDATTRYVDTGKWLYELVLKLPKSCYTIKETSYLRKDADAKSKVLATLVYDTELEILEDIPRWYKVKYTDEKGREMEGWISKISVVV